MADACLDIARFEAIETTADHVAMFLPDLIAGHIPALLVKSFLDESSCRRIIDNFGSSHGRYKRTDGVPAMMVGSNGYLKGVDGVVDEFARNSWHGELLFQGTGNAYRRFFDAVEDSGFRFRVAYADGIPAAAYRAAMWDDRSQSGVILKPHTDWPQVANSRLEYADVRHPIGVNMYAVHPPKGSSWIRLYDFVPSREWLEARGIDDGGYPIEQKDLIGQNYMDILPEQGDLLLFTASRVHAVHVADYVGAAQRLNINGFIGYSPAARRVLAWA
ncbi:hypothetical protein [Luteimonas sp. TWI1416]|uniref:hypothetical protein n=1 Tax=unclassified Luteimonas TaxID=2629088 RepID=UPI00320AA002